MKVPYTSSVVRARCREGTWTAEWPLGQSFATVKYQEVASPRTTVGLLVRDGRGIQGILQPDRPVRGIGEKLIMQVQHGAWRDSVGRDVARVEDEEVSCLERHISDPSVRLQSHGMDKKVAVVRAAAIQAIGVEWIGGRIAGARKEVAPICFGQFGHGAALRNFTDIHHQ